MADVAKGSVLLTPKFNNLKSTIEGAFSGVESVGSSSGTKTAKSFAKSIAAGSIISSAVTSVVQSAFSLVSDSVDDAVSRLDTLESYPKVMQNLGYSAEDASASIEEISDGLNGLPSSTDDVASVVQSLSPMCDTLDEATDLGLALNDMMLASGASTDDASRAMEQYTQMFSKGTVDMDAWYTLQEVIPGQLNQVAESMLGAGASSTDLYEALQDGTLSMEDMNEAIMELDSEGGSGFASFHDQALDATGGIESSFENMKTAITRGVTEILEAVGSSNISAVLTGIGSAFEAGLGGVAGVVGDVVSYIEDIGAALVSSGVAVEFQNFASLIADSFGEAGDAVGGLVEEIAPSAEQVAEVIGDVLDGIEQAYLGVSEWFGELGAALEDAGVGEMVEEIFGAITDLAEPAGEAIDGIKTALSQLEPPPEAVATVLNLIVSALQAFVNIAAEKATMVLEALPVLFSAFATVLSTVITVIWNVVSAIGTFVTNVVTFFTVTIPAAITTLATWFLSIPTTIATMVTTAIESLATFVSGVVEKARSAGSDFYSIISEKFSNAVSFVKNIPQKIATALSTLASKVRTKATTAGQAFKDALSDKFDAAVDLVKNIPGRVKSALGDLSSTLYNKGTQIVQGFINGIKDKLSNIGDAISGAVDTAISTVNSLLKIGSPSKVFREIGEYTMEGFAEGISSGASGVTAEMESATGALIASAEVNGTIDGGSSGNVTNYYIGDTQVNGTSGEAFAEEFIALMKKYGRLAAL